MNGSNHSTSASNQTTIRSEEVAWYKNVATVTGELYSPLKLVNPLGSASSPHQAFDKPNNFGNPSHFHVTLKPHSFLEERHVDLKFSSKLAVTGLVVQTTRTNRLESFSLQYSRFDHVVQSGGEMKTLEVLSDFPHVSRGWVCPDIRD